MKTFRKMLAIALLIVMVAVLMPILNPTEVHAETTPSYLTFTALEDNSSVTFKYGDTTKYECGTNVCYSIDGGKNWENIEKGKACTVSLKNKDDSVSFKGKNVRTGDSSGHFSMSGKIAASGDVTSLTNETGGDVALKESCYSSMFSGCTALTTAPNLPSKTLAKLCYGNMFDGCAALTAAPELPATTLADSCYSSMFKGCTALTAAPELKATTLADSCYSSMFSGCTALTAAPELKVTTLAEYCYNHMFEGCTALTAAPELPATTLVKACYYYMFLNCTALTAPAMMDKVSTLGPYCCAYMYQGCTKLEIYKDSKSGYTKEWKAANTTTGAESWAQNMFSGCGASVDVAAGSTYYIACGIAVGEQQGTLTYGTGSSATFEVGLVGVDEPDNFTEAWYKNGKSLSGPPTGVTTSYSKTDDKFTVYMTAATPAGSYQFTLTSNEVTSAEATLTVGAKKISDCTVANIPDQTYTGSALEPAVTVKDGDTTTLQKDTDYTVTYTNNVNAGTAKATITGKGNYTGGVDKEFTIAKSKELKIIDQATGLEFGTRTYSFAYDGQEHASDALIASGGLTGWVTYQYSTDGGATWTKLRTNKAWCWSDTKIVNDKVQIKVEDPNYETASCAINFTISPREITITDITAADKEYDGTTNAAVSFTKSGELSGEDVTVGYTASFDTKNAGEDKSVSIEFSLSGSNKDNYVLNPASKTCKASISPKALTITGTAVNGKTYDGTNAAVIGTMGTVSGIVGEDNVKVTATAEFQNVDAGNGRGVTITYSLSGDDAGNYLAPETPETDHPAADINKRSVTLTSGDGSKKYDGTALTNSTVTVSGDGWATGEGATYTVTGTQTFVGRSDNAFTYALIDGTKADNYEITEAKGTLTVTKRTAALTITVNDQTKTYDGTAVLPSADAYTVSGDVATGDILTVTLSTEKVDAGTYADAITATYKIMHGDTDVTDMYLNVTVDNGDLTVNKRSVTLTSADDTKKYDGTALTNGTVTVSGDGFVEGEGATYSSFATLTKVDNAENTFTYALNNGTLADNYTITKVEGTLTVTPRPVTLTSGDTTKEYDGLPLTNENVSVSGDGWVTGEGATYSDFASITGVGAASNAFVYTLNNDTKAINYDITCEYGTLTVTAQQLDGTGAKLESLPPEIQENLETKLNTAADTAVENLSLISAFNGNGIEAAESSSITQVLGNTGFMEILLKGVGFDGKADELTAESEIVTAKFDVTPYDAEGTAQTTLNRPVTFRLPLFSTEYAYANVYHEDQFYQQIFVDKNKKFIEVTANKFSEYSYTLTNTSRDSGVSTYAVTVSTADHGNVTVSPKNASAGSTVTLTVKPDKGYTLETLTVLDKNGKEIELTAKTVGETYTFVMPRGAISVKATFMEDNTMLNSFVDVKADDYFYDAVLWAVEKGITTGTDAAHFNPTGITSRAQMVTFLWRAAGCPDVALSDKFSDVSTDSYYAKAVAWAIEKGITTGTDATHFNPNANVNRAQTVTFLARLAGVDTSASSTFADVNANSYYAGAVAWAVANGITTGTSANTFSPTNACLRAQVVTFLYRYFVK